MHDNCQFPAAGSSGQWMRTRHGERKMRWIRMVLPAAIFAGTLRLYALAGFDGQDALDRVLAGAMQSPGQWMFLPGFALILGYVRALSGSVWAGMGVHFAWMTTS